MDIGFYIGIILRAPMSFWSTNIYICTYIYTYIYIERETVAHVVFWAPNHSSCLRSAGTHGQRRSDAAPQLQPSYVSHGQNSS